MLKNYRLNQYVEALSKELTLGKSDLTKKKSNTYALE